jgi:hypothetical protein
VTDQADSKTDSGGAAARLRRFTAQSQALHVRYLTNAGLLQRYSAFVHWQTTYMSSFYDDLRSQHGYSAALDFVITDLTGLGISQRDEDLARAVPIMVRMLPEKALESLAAAMELNAAVLRINLAVCDRLAERNPGAPICEAEFCAAYRDAATLKECLALAALTRQLGESLDRVARVRALGLMLKAMHRPARAAGFSALHDFLTKGYQRFHAIEDVPRFLELMHGRMVQVLTRIFEAPMDSLSTTPAPWAASR